MTQRIQTFVWEPVYLARRGQALSDCTFSVKPRSSISRSRTRLTRLLPRLVPASRARHSRMRKLQSSLAEFLAADKFSIHPFTFLGYGFIEAITGRKLTTLPVSGSSSHVKVKFCHPFSVRNPPLPVSRLLLSRFNVRGSSVPRNTRSTSGNCPLSADSAVERHSSSATFLALLQPSAT